MSASQESVLRAVSRQSMTAVGIATVVDAKVPSVERTLNALCRQSLVDRDDGGRWCATERGRKKAAK